MQLPLPAAMVLEAALNTLLRLDSHAAARLPAMQGKMIDLQVQGLELHIYLLMHGDRIEVLPFFDGEIDVTISGTPISLASLSVSRRALSEGEVVIGGDIATGQKFHRLLASINVDLEELLSHLTGDTVAHQLGNAARNTQHWLNRSMESLRDDLGEYLREESRLTPGREECEHFHTAVDTLRSDADRLEARLNHYLHHRKPHKTTRP